MASISAAVKRVGADLGVIFDTDCDRAAVVDADAVSYTHLTLPTT